MGDKFDFRTADRLVDAVNKTAATLDVKNGQMEKYFGNLHDSFRDPGYDEFTGDMTAADKAIKEVIKQMHAVSKAIADYSNQLRENT